MTDARPTTVYFDGSCPLCRAEVDIYRRQDASGALCLIDVSAPDAPVPDGLNRDAAMARFHVLSADGRLLSGAQAFAEVWRRLPQWRWAGSLADIRPVGMALEAFYRLFLTFRPALVRAFVALSRRREKLDASR